MALEIEKRFLIKNDQWKEFIIDHNLIEQGYFKRDTNGWITRVRSIGGEFKLTLKKHIINSSSHEFEYDIPSKDGEFIMSNLCNKIKKERFNLKVKDQKWIIDIFQDDNFPLEIAEIELYDDNEKIPIPHFISTEITGIKNFSNYQLSQYPFSKWKKKDLLNFLSD